MFIKYIFWDFGGVIVKDNLKPAFIELGIPYSQQVKDAWKEHRLGKITQDDFYFSAINNTKYIGLILELKNKAKELIKLQEDGALSLIERLNKKYKQGAISNHSKEWGKYIIEIEEIFNNSEITIYNELTKERKTHPIKNYSLNPQLSIVCSPR